VSWLPWPAAWHDTPSAGPADDPENHLIASETQRAVRRALDALSPRARQALILREYEGLSYAELGSVLGVSQQAVKSILFRAREEFRKHYEAPEANRTPTGVRK
jgi:RNA polymerase sigma-70 factor (ECF subfamily)